MSYWDVPERPLEPPEDKPIGYCDCCGGEVYKAMLPYCGKAIITKVNASPEAAVFFPNLDNDESWELTEQSEEYSCEGLKYRFCTYARK